MNKIWPIGSIGLLIAFNIGLPDRNHMLKSIKTIDSRTATVQMLGEALAHGNIPPQSVSQASELPEPPEVVARIQRVIDSLVEEIERPMGVQFTIDDIAGYR